MSAKLEISLKMTLPDGAVQEVKSSHDFPTEDEAEDMYWQVLNGAVGASANERAVKRGKGQSKSKR